MKYGNKLYYKISDYEYLKCKFIFQYPDTKEILIESIPNKPPSTIFKMTQDDFNTNCTVEVDSIIDGLYKMRQLETEKLSHIDELPPKYWIFKYQQTKHNINIQKSYYKHNDTYISKSIHQMEKGKRRIEKRLYALSKQYPNVNVYELTLNDYNKYTYEYNILLIDQALKYLQIVRDK